MMKEKMTKKDWFAMVREVVSNAEMTEVEKKGALAFIDREVELLNKKSSNSRDTKKQQENKAIAEVVVAELKKLGKPMAISEMIKASEVLGAYSTQKLTPILKALKDEQRVVMTTEKKRNYYSVVQFQGVGNHPTPKNQKVGGRNDQTRTD